VPELEGLHVIIPVVHTVGNCQIVHEQLPLKCRLLGIHYVVDDRGLLSLEIVQRVKLSCQIGLSQLDIVLECEGPNEGLETIISQQHISAAL
jgi:hypothetical protein